MNSAHLHSDTELDSLRQDLLDLITFPLQSEERERHLRFAMAFNDLLWCLYSVFSTVASSRSALCFHPNFGWWLVLVVGGWWLNNARKTLKNRNCDHCVHHSPFDVYSGTRIIIFDYQDQCLPQACLYKGWRKCCEKLPEDCSKWTFESFLSPGEGNVHLESTSQEGTSTLHVPTIFNLWQPSFAFLCRKHAGR